MTTDRPTWSETSDRLASLQRRVTDDTVSAYLLGYLIAASADDPAIFAAIDAALVSAERVLLETVEAAA